MPWWLKKCWRSARRLLACAHERRDVALEGVDLVGDRLREHEADPGDDQQQRGGRSAGSRARGARRGGARKLTNGLRISAMNDATMMISTTLRAARAATHSASRPTSEQHELHAVRDHEWSGRRGRQIAPAHPPRRPDRRSARCSSAAVWRSCPPIRASSSAATSSARRAGAPCSRRCPALRERHEPTFVVVNGENVAGGFGITPDDRRRAVRGGRRRDHARQPRLPPPRDLPLPRRASRGSCGPRTTCTGSRATGHTVVERDGVRLGVVNLSGNVFMAAGRSAFAEADALVARLTGDGRPHARRHARRGDEREGRDGLAPRRPRDRGARDAHARADRRRAGAAGRDRLHHRRRHDRRARRRARRRAASSRSRRSSRRCRCGSRPSDEDPWLRACSSRERADARRRDRAAARARRARRRQRSARARAAARRSPERRRARLDARSAPRAARRRPSPANHGM